MSSSVDDVDLAGRRQDRDQTWNGVYDQARLAFVFAKGFLRPFAFGHVERRTPRRGQEFRRTACRRSDRYAAAVLLEQLPFLRLTAPPRFSSSITRASRSRHSGRVKSVQRNDLKRHRHGLPNMRRNSSLAETSGRRDPK